MQLNFFFGYPYLHYQFCVADEHIEDVTLELQKFTGFCNFLFRLSNFNRTPLHHCKFVTLQFICCCSWFKLLLFRLESGATVQLFQTTATLYDIKRNINKRTSDALADLYYGQLRLCLPEIQFLCICALLECIARLGQAQD